MYRLKYIGVIVLYLITYLGYSQAIHKEFSTKNGYQDYIYSVKEGPSGAIYFSTENGVFRYLNNTTTFYKTATAIDEIVIDSDEKKLFLSTLEEGELLQLNLDTKEIIKLKSSKNYNYRAINKAEHTFLTFGASSTIQLFNIEKDSAVNHKLFFTYTENDKMKLTEDVSVENKVDTRIQLDTDNTFYLFEGMQLFNNRNTLKGIYNLKEDNSVTQVYENFADKVINGFSKEKDRTLFTSADSLFIVEDSTVKKYQIPFKANGFEIEIPYKLATINQDYILFLSHQRHQFNTKLFLFNLKTQSLRSVASLLNLKSESVSNFHLDRDKNIWVGTNGEGVFKILNFENNFINSHFYNNLDVYQAKTIKDSMCMFLLQHEIKFRHNSVNFKTYVIEESAQEFHINRERIFALFKHSSFKESKGSLIEKLQYDFKTKNVEVIYGDNLYKVNDSITLYEDELKLCLVNNITFENECYDKPKALHSKNIEKIEDNIYFLNASNIQVFNMSKNAFIPHVLNDYGYSNLKPYTNNSLLASSKNTLLLLDSLYNVKQSVNLSEGLIRDIYVDDDDYIWVSQEKNLTTLNQNLDVLKHIEVSDLAYDENIEIYQISPKNEDEIYILTTKGAYLLDRLKTLSIQPNTDYISVLDHEEAYLRFAANASIPSIIKFRYNIDGGLWQDFNFEAISKQDFSHGEHSIIFQYFNNSGQWQTLSTHTFNVNVHWLKRPEILTGIVLFISLAIISGICLFLKSQKKRKLEITGLIDSKKKLETKISQIQNSFAMDLHDNFGNRLSGIKSSHSILNELRSRNDYESPNFSKFLNHMDHAVDALMHDVKDLMWANNQENNTALKLADRIENIIELFNITQSVKILFVKRIEKDFDLPYFWNRQILFIVKECINNSLKYANAQSITVKLYSDSKMLYLICRDDGIGFEIEKTIRKSGISHIKKRAAEINCKLDIFSKPNVGTTIELRGNIEIEVDAEMNYNNIINN